MLNLSTASRGVFNFSWSARLSVIGNKCTCLYFGCEFFFVFIVFFSLSLSLFVLDAIHFSSCWSIRYQRLHQRYAMDTCLVISINHNQQTIFVFLIMMLPLIITYIEFHLYIQRLSYSIRQSAHTHTYFKCAGMEKQRKRSK